MSKIALTEQDQIAPRQVGDAVPEIGSVDPGLGQYNFGDLNQFVEFAKVMCQAGEMLPQHAQRNPSICLALTMRAVHWGFDPFALAMETYQAKQGGPVGYQAKVFTAVLRKAGVNLRYRYEGEIKMLDTPVKSYKGNEIAKRTATGDRRCIAYIEEDGDLLEYETMTLDQITIKNSPLWHNDPDQQLAYAAGRGWARRYRPDLMMGAYSEDEVREMRPMRDVTPKQTGFQRLAEEARQKAAEGDKAPDPATPPENEDKAAPAPDQAASDGPSDDATTHETSEGPEIDPQNPAYTMGVEAAESGLFTMEQCPFKGEDSAADRANWEAGFNSVEREDGDDPENA